MSENLLTLSRLAFFLPMKEFRDELGEEPPLRVVLPLSANLDMLKKKLSFFRMVKKSSSELGELKRMTFALEGMKIFEGDMPADQVFGEVSLVVLPQDTSALHDPEDEFDLILMPDAHPASPHAHFWVQSDSGYGLYESPFMRSFDILAAALVLAPDSELDGIFKEIVEINPSYASDLLDKQLSIPVLPSEPIEDPSAEKEIVTRDIAPFIRPETIQPILSNKDRDVRLKAASSLRR